MNHPCLRNIEFVSLNNIAKSANGFYNHTVRSKLIVCDRIDSSSSTSKSIVILSGGTGNIGDDAQSMVDQRC